MVQILRRLFGMHVFIGAFFLFWTAVSGTWSTLWPLLVGAISGAVLWGVLLRFSVKGRAQERAALLANLRGSSERAPESLQIVLYLRPFSSDSSAFVKSSGTMNDFFALGITRPGGFAHELLGSVPSGWDVVQVDASQTYTPEEWMGWVLWRMRRVRDAISEKPVRIRTNGPDWKDEVRSLAEVSKRIVVAPPIPSASSSLEEIDLLASTGHLLKTAFVMPTEMIGGTKAEEGWACLRSRVLRALPGVTFPQFDRSGGIVVPVRRDRFELISGFAGVSWHKRRALRRVLWGDREYDPRLCSSLKVAALATLRTPAEMLLIFFLFVLLIEFVAETGIDEAVFYVYLASPVLLIMHLRGYSRRLSRFRIRCNRRKLLVRTAQICAIGAIVVDHSIMDQVHGVLERADLGEALSGIAALATAGLIGAMAVGPALGVLAYLALGSQCVACAWSDTGTSES